MPCDFGSGSFCATMAKLDITHNINIFIPGQQAGYNSWGCNWWPAKITQIQNLASTTNPLNLARRKSKIDYFNCMAENCGCTPPLPPNRYGCMDDGDMPPSYMNNSGMWDFQTLNNTTSSGVVINPVIPTQPGFLFDMAPFMTSGVHYGTPYTLPLDPNTGQRYPAENYDPTATVDDGSCNYSWDVPIYGCMRNTPHDPMIHGTPHGYPDINGHGTNAVYKCMDGTQAPHYGVHTPIAPDPCGSGVGTPCTGATNNTGYFVQNFSPCAHYSCKNPNPNLPVEWGKNPAIASDMNWWFTHHEDDPNQLGWTQPPSNPPGQQNFRSFGDESCCTQPVPLAPPSIEYNYRYGDEHSVGACNLSGDSANGVFSNNVIGESHIILRLNKYDVRLNRSSPETEYQGQAMNVTNIFNTLVPPIDWSGPPSCPAPSCPPNPYTITVYDLNEQLIGKWEYQCVTSPPAMCSYGSLTNNTGGPDCSFYVFLSCPVPHPGTPNTFDLSSNSPTSPTWPLASNVMKFQTLGGACDPNYPNHGPTVSTPNSYCCPINQNAGPGYPYYILIENIATNGIKVHPNGNGWGNTANLTNYAGLGIDMRFINSTNGLPIVPGSDFYYNKACCYGAYNDNNGNLQHSYGSCHFAKWFSELPPSHTSFSQTCSTSSLHPWYDSILYQDCYAAAPTCNGTPFAPIGGTSLQNNTTIASSCDSNISTTLTITI